MSLSEAEKKQISELRIGLDGKQLITAAEFLRDFRNGQSDRISLVGKLLNESLASQHADEVELALLAGFSFGFSEAHINVLASLAQAEWHHSHEDIASAFDEIRAPGAVNALHLLAQWVPEYLAFDDARALASKAVWALAKIGDPSAKRALQEIADSQSDLIGTLAQEKLCELGATPPGA